MPDRFARRYPARPRRAAVRCGGWLAPSDAPNGGPVAPPELRAERPDPEGVRRGLVGFYRTLLAGGSLDTPERAAAAEARLFDRLGG